MQCLNDVVSESTVVALKCSTWLTTFKVSLNRDLREILTEKHYEHSQIVDLNKLF